MVKYAIKNNIYAVLIPIGAMVLLLLISDPIFENPDDMVIIATYSGKLGYPISNDAVFISSILGTIFQNLYMLNPNIPWYSSTLYLLHFISLMLGAKIILNVYESLQIRLFCMFCFLSIYASAFYQLSFTATSLLIWFFTMLYIMYLNLEGKAPDKKDIVLGLLLIIGFLLRPSIPLGMLAFSLPILVSCLLPGVKMRFVYAILPIIIVIFLSSFFGEYIISNQRYDEYYWELQSARSRLVDTIEGIPSNTTEKAISAAGWTEADYYLAGNLYWTHDEEVYNIENINMFLKHNRKSFLQELFPHTLSLVMLLFSLFVHRLNILILFAAFFLLVGFKDNKKHFKSIDAININNKTVKWVISIVLFILFIGFIYLTSYRLPSRVAVPLFLYFFILYILLSPILNRYFFQSSSFLNYKIKLIAASVIVMLFTIYNFSQIIEYSNYAASKKDLQNRSIMIIKENYGEDILFVGLTRDRYLSFAHPLKEFNEIVEFNIIPNVWIVGTNLYYNYLNNYGIESGREFMIYAINNDDIIFRFAENPYISFSEYGTYFTEHVNNHYGYLYPGSNIKLEIILEEEIDEDLMLYFFKLKA